MKKSKKITGAIIAVLCTAAVAGVFYFVGYGTASDRTEDSASGPQTFYAVISDIQDNRLTVKGMEVNDINFRGSFCFSIGEETKLTWRNADIPIQDLNAGDNIAVSFTGDVLETDPAQLQRVVAVRLLDD